MKKVKQDEKQIEEAQRRTADQVTQAQHSVICANAVVDQLIEQGGQMMYNKYISKKIQPFTTKQIISTIVVPLEILNINKDDCENPEKRQLLSQSQQPKASQTCQWSSNKLKVVVPQPIRRLQSEKTESSIGSDQSVQKMKALTMKGIKQFFGKQSFGKIPTKPDNKQAGIQSVEVKNMEEDIIDIKVNQLRKQKLVEERRLQSELAAREKRMNQFTSNKSSETVQRAIQNLKGLKQESNLFEQLYARGDGLTFDDSGMPIIFKQDPPKAQLHSLINFEVQPEVHITKFSRANISRRSTIWQQQPIELVQSSKAEKIFEAGHLQNIVIESTSSGVVKSIEVQAGVQLIDNNKKQILGPPLEFKNQLSLNQYAKMIDQSVKKYSNPTPINSKEQSQEVIQSQKDPYQTLISQESSRAQTAQINRRKLSDQRNSQISTPELHTKFRVSHHNSQVHESSQRPKSQVTYHDVVKHDSKKAGAYEMFIKNAQIQNQYASSKQKLFTKSTGQLSETLLTQLPLKAQSSEIKSNLIWRQKYAGSQLNIEVSSTIKVYKNKEERKSVQSLLEIQRQLRMTSDEHKPLKRPQTAKRTTIKQF